MTAEEMIRRDYPEMLARRTPEGTADHAWREEWGTSRPWDPNIYPMGIMCSGCGLGMDKHPIQPGHTLTDGVYDPSLA
jgi:hypothetical protein